ncbi:LysR family transcriptional regulator [Shewanella eurypsychrophilus]|uniref:LysR family transcriptional regulator n=1 Tax=Shewanella eurypsychrophilus TaxID=2593656 RepID=A0ABX6VAL9_9GAMM|nr:MULTISPECIES: LysR family transcriptional regulator [Shewanella]QFU23701.1 LysR family transcriptional regulator [Shewanella sp. YLB-09]QPG58923.1 LysR family transcriptional regulator [Shewanella eurypsychrophilus]
MAQNKQFDVNLLRVFLTVCRTGSYTLAAEELDLTQPSVSNAISRFKSVIGEELFVRAGRNIKPTAMANYLYEQLNDSFTNIEQTINGLEGFDPMTSERQFVILTNDVVAHLLQNKLDTIIQDLPIEVVFREPPDFDGEIFEMLNLEQADIAIDIGLPKDNRFERMLLMSEPATCVVSCDHPRIQQQITREQFFAERHVLVNLRRFNLTAVDLISEEVLPSRKVHSSKSSMLSLLAAVSTSDAIGIAPKNYANGFAQMFNLQLVPIPFKTKALDIEVVWKKKHNRNPAHIWLRETILGMNLY